MKRLVFCFFLLLLAAGSIPALELPADGFAEGWQQAGETRRFAGNDLYGHIDGGAELFHEFGFAELYVLSYKKGEAELGLEMYLMESSEAALGIYLMKVHKETPARDLSIRNSAHISQITALKGPCFLQVNNFGFDSTLFPAMLGLVSEALKTLEADTLRPLLDMLPRDCLVPGSAKLIRGQYGLQPIYTLGEGDILQLGGEIYGAVGRYEDSVESFTCIIVEYPTDEAAESAYANVVANLDSYLTVLESAQNDLIFRDYRDEYGFVRVRSNRIGVFVHLAEYPHDLHPLR